MEQLNMDSALKLKMKVTSESIFEFNEANPLLKKSQLFNELLTDIKPSSLNLLWRLIQLSEIPFSQEYQIVRDWRDELAELTFCEHGFSLTGKTSDILACYNAMITSVLIKLGYCDLFRINQGINWIISYQNVARNQTTDWTGRGIQKYGGCMKATPCFIGVVKSMIALSDYKMKANTTQQNLNDKLAEGLEYILKHQVFKTFTSGQPITRDITSLTYPFTYKTNIIEILRLLKDNNLTSDSRVSDAISLLSNYDLKKPLRYHYMPKYWIKFDKPKQRPYWLEFEIRNILEANE